MSTSAVHLARLASPQAGERAGSILAVPLGSTEQHGLHLPLDTDTVVARHLCERLAAARPDVVVAPALPYGASGEHAGFPGTLSLGTDALEHVLVELVRSATDTFAHIALVNGHGGNSEAARRAVARLRDEGRDVQLFGPRYAGDAHAGRVETSLMLALRPADVRLEAAVTGNTRPLAELWPVLRAGGVAAVTPTGVLGDPTGASAAEGHRLLDDITGRLLADVAGWRPAVPA